MTSLVLRHVELAGGMVDVLVEDGRIARLGEVDPPPGAEVVDGEGGALIPGLWDHHVHLVALAAARRSVLVGPPAVHHADALQATLRAARPAVEGGWVRAVGYHESVAGMLDRHALDRLLPGVPVRVQHRSGALWILSGTAIDRLGIDDEDRPGLERDDAGRLTGRLYGDDRWLRERLRTVTADVPPDLASVGRKLASYGVVGATDATPYERLDDLALLAGAAASGALPQRLVVTGGPALSTDDPPSPLVPGPVKLRLADHDLPSLDELAGWVTAAHTAGRPVAVHCVTRAALVLTLAALDDAGSLAGDRIEHGAVVPPELHPQLLRHRLTVVTQPNFVAERGDRYLADVDPDDLAHLYPCRALLDDGIPVAGSTDAPFGHPDPWRAIRAAVERRTATGTPLGTDEAVAPRRALDLFLGAPGDPGRQRRQVVVGAPADLCLLDRSLSDALSEPSADAVAATVVAGRVVFGR